jgi:cysteine-S-conjugate beta-lyase
MMRKHKCDNIIRGDDMRYNFDEIIERKGTNSEKWDDNKNVFGRDDILPMWVADMDFPAPAEAIEAIKRRLTHPILGYTFPKDEAYLSVINKMKRTYNADISKEDIVFCDGVVGGIYTSIKSLTKEGENILILEPVYHPFKMAIKDLGRNPVISNLILEDGKYRLDFKDIEEKIKDTKLIIFCSPHNPVSRVWKEEELIKLSRIIEKSESLIISDEIHCDLIYKGYKHIPYLLAAPKIKNRLITFIAPSKTYNLAGLSQSLAIITDENIRDKFKKGNAFRNYGNMFGIEALTAAYDSGDEYIKELMDYIEGNKDYFISYVNKNINKLKVIEPEGTYLLWVDFKGLNLSLKELDDLILNKAKLGVNNGKMFGESGAFYYRFNIACPRDYIKEALLRLQEAVNNI